MMVAKYPERLTRSTGNPLPVDQPLTVATPRPADVLVDMLWNDTGMPAQAPLEREFLREQLAAVTSFSGATCTRSRPVTRSGRDQ
jgi:hypothetical protein